MGEEADTSAKFISHRGINSLKSRPFSRPFIQRTTTPDHLKHHGRARRQRLQGQTGGTSRTLRRNGYRYEGCGLNGRRVDGGGTQSSLSGLQNVIGARRASWRIISSIEQKEEN